MDFTGRKGPYSFIVIANEAKVSKNEKGEIIGRYLTVQEDQSLKKPDKVRTGEAEAQTNPYLNERYSDTMKRKEHSVFYYEKQYQAMKKAAGKKSFIADRNGAELEVFGIQAELGYGKEAVRGKNDEVKKDDKGKTITKQIVIIDTSKPMTPTKNIYFGKTVLDKQAAVTQAAKEYAATQKEAAKEVEGVKEEVKAKPKTKSKAQRAKEKLEKTEEAEISKDEDQLEI